jgi:malic enzyme
VSYFICRLYVRLKKLVIGSQNAITHALTYPSIGFGAILSQSRNVLTDTMLIEGAKHLAMLSPAIQAAASLKISKQYEYNGGGLLPDFGIAPGVSFKVGIAVAEQAERRDCGCFMVGY